ncbi:hypothetical protein B0H10DRAFT_1946982 [Mycena sp. CBHHK59/15]|nr:hypothetical protein B0H10DRAFT_1946982 [Mycena sp. CBHHK59/15]
MFDETLAVKFSTLITYIRKAGKLAAGILITERGQERRAALSELLLDLGNCRSHLAHARLEHGQPSVHEKRASGPAGRRGVARIGGSRSDDSDKRVWVVEARDLAAGGKPDFPCAQPLIVAGKFSKTSQTPRPCFRGTSHRLNTRAANTLTPRSSVTTPTLRSSARTPRPALEHKHEEAAEAPKRQTCCAASAAARVASRRRACGFGSKGTGDAGRDRAVQYPLEEGQHPDTVPRWGCCSSSLVLEEYPLGLMRHSANANARTQPDSRLHNVCGWACVGMTRNDTSALDSTGT